MDCHGALHAPFSGCVRVGKEDAGYGRGPKLYCLSSLGVFHLLLPAEPTGLHKPCFVLWVCPVSEEILSVCLWRDGELRQLLPSVDCMARAAKRYL